MNNIRFIILLMSFIFSIAGYAEEADKNNLTAHQQWLKSKFNEQHTQLIPVVAVADMLFACNKANDQDYGNYSLDVLISKMDKERLAEKLISCLAGESVKSETAINYGLLGCFEDQFNHLPEAEKLHKMTLVNNAVISLPFDEKKKSFTQCVTDQSIGYLK